MVTDVTKERTDDIGFGGLQLIQQPEEFCYGVDAVILADFASKCEPDTAADLGTGTGIIPMILSHKTDARSIVGIEVQQASYERACRNVILNDLAGRVSMVRGDVSDAAIKDLVLRLSGTDELDLVTCNPPYTPMSASLENANMAKHIARHETTATLDDFVAFGSALLRERGHYYMVHRPSRLVDIFASMRRHRLEPKELRMVAPHSGAEPNIVLVHAVKGGGPELKVLDTLCIHEAGGGYTEEINKIYERK